MATLRETLQSAIATAEAELAEKKVQLANLEVEAAPLLETEYLKVKAWFQTITSHIHL